MKQRMTPKKKKYVELVLKLAQPGDVLTYTVCMGEIREIVFKRMEGCWMVGTPTADSIKINGLSRKEMIDDVHPLNVTHINREVVAHIQFMNDLNGFFENRRKNVNAHYK